jgi:hypothetical protein
MRCRIGRCDWLVGIGRTHRRDGEKRLFLFGMAMADVLSHGEYLKDVVYHHHEYGHLSDRLFNDVSLNLK